MSTQTTDGPASLLAERASSGSPIRIENLVKSYAAFTAVDDVTLDIEAGEFMTFLGPSGSGKTTTLNIIAGFDSPTSGSLHLDGKAITSTPPHRRDIGMVFQNYALFPHMTVAQNVVYPLKRRGMGKSESTALVAAALATVHLGEFGHRYPRELSGGQQQRVAVARAIVFSPRVLLMDEPLGALDKKLRDWLQLEIKRIHQQLGTTFVYVTHDQEEALVLSDRIAVFNNGKIEQVGSAEELYERPSTLFVAKFLGDSTVLQGAASARADGASDVRIGSDTVTAAGALDGAAAVVIRPERITVQPAGSAVPAATTGIRGSVGQVIYLGSHRKLEVSLLGGGTANVREQTGHFSAAVLGDPVQLSWRPQDAVLLPDTGAVDVSHT